jgi:uncharacterized protein
MKPIRRSSDADFEAYDALCQRLAGFDDRISTEWVEGWLTALACGPVRPPADQWVTLMLDDTFDRACADPLARAEALAVLGGRLAVLLDQLDPESIEADPSHLRLDPLMWEWSDSERQRMADESGFTLADLAAVDTGVVWAAGFLDGTEALADTWGEPVADDEALAQFDELLEQVAALGHAPGDAAMVAFLERYHPGRQPTRDELVAEACFAVQDLRLWWLDHGPRPMPRRVQRGPGRNDPCPCGSGRKYKKCHGAAA